MKRNVLMYFPAIVMGVVIFSGMLTLAVIASDSRKVVKVPVTQAPAQEVLDRITKRGTLLASYDKACWKATDILLEAKPDRTRMKLYIAKENTDGQWEVVFGNLKKDHSAFRMAYKVVLTGKEQKGKLIAFSPMIEDRGFYRKAAIALNQGMGDLTEDPRFDRTLRYNFAVLPFKKKNFWVYFYPAQTVPNIFPLGGDIRYLMCGASMEILEKRRMHNSILNVPAPIGDNIPEYGVHVAVIDNLPEDSDVFHVLTRKPSIPEYILTEKFVYLLDTKGKISFKGDKDTFLKTTPEGRKMKFVD